MRTARRVPSDPVKYFNFNNFVHFQSCILADCHAAPCSHAIDPFLNKKLSPGRARVPTLLSYPFLLRSYVRFVRLRQLESFAFRIMDSLCSCPDAREACARARRDKISLRCIGPARRGLVSAKPRKPRVV